MNREKQIEEMARCICERDDGDICTLDSKSCDCKCTSGSIAELLYDRGYRKRSNLAPCKIGDKVYDVIVDGGKLYIEELTVTEVATKRIFCSAHVPPEDDIDIVIPLEEIGVNVFFSREAAEAAGKEMEGGGKE